MSEANLGVPLPSTPAGSSAPVELSCAELWGGNKRVDTPIGTPGVTGHLLSGATDCLLRHGIEEEGITVVRVPGANEIPQVVQRLAASAVAADGVLAGLQRDPRRPLAAGAQIGESDHDRAPGVQRG